MTDNEVAKMTVAAFAATGKFCPIIGRFFFSFQKNTKVMKIIKGLNLYACLGGNRYKWDEVANIQITAVELDPELARLYQERFPNDIVVIADAHQYLLDHFKEFDFIWSSPPCPTHSRARFWNAVSDKTSTVPMYPEMKLYQEIILLKYWFKGKYCIENVIPYYTPMIPGQKRDRHLYWTNFVLPSKLSNRTKQYTGIKDNIKKLSNYHDFDFTTYKGDQKLYKIARNLVDYEAGKTIFSYAVKSILNKPLADVGLFSSNAL